MVTVFQDSSDSSQKNAMTQERKGMMIMSTHVLTAYLMTSSKYKVIAAIAELTSNCVVQLFISSSSVVHL